MSRTWFTTRCFLSFSLFFFSFPHSRTEITRQERVYGNFCRVTEYLCHSAFRSLRHKVIPHRVLGTGDSECSRCYLRHATNAVSRITNDLPKREGKSFIFRPWVYRCKIAVIESSRFLPRKRYQTRTRSNDFQPGCAKGEKNVQRANSGALHTARTRFETSRGGESDLNILRAPFDRVTVRYRVADTTRDTHRSTRGIEFTKNTDQTQISSTRVHDL